MKALINFLILAAVAAVILLWCKFPIQMGCISALIWVFVIVDIRRTPLSSSNFE